MHAFDSRGRRLQKQSKMQLLLLVWQTEFGGEWREDAETSTTPSPSAQVLNYYNNFLMTWNVIFIIQLLLCRFVWNIYIFGVLWCSGALCAWISSFWRWIYIVNIKHYVCIPHNKMNIFQLPHIGPKPGPW